MLSSLAVSEAVITDDEKELGVVVLDIGAGTSNFAVFHENELIQTGVVPFGGEVVTRDIKEGCSILLKWAEQLKVQYGQALGDFADDQKVVTIPGYNGWEPKEISFKSLAFIIQARVEEIIEHVFKQIENSEIHYQMRAGVVITGGTSNLENIVSLIKFRSGMDVRKANLLIQINQKKKEISSSENYTALGLLKLILDKTATPTPVVKKVKKEKKKREGGGLSPWINKVVQGVLDMVDDDNEDVAMK
jgi:cell division protein FtsA